MAAGFQNRPSHKGVNDVAGILDLVASRESIDNIFKLFQASHPLKDVFTDQSRNEIRSFLRSNGSSLAVNMVQKPTGRANVSTTNINSHSKPDSLKIVQDVMSKFRLNNSWAWASLSASMMNSDPVSWINKFIANYWIDQSNLLLVDTLRGVFAANAAAPGPNAMHVQNDMTYDISGTQFVRGTTNFSADAFGLATLSMSDATLQNAVILAHPVIVNAMVREKLLSVTKVPTDNGISTVKSYMDFPVISSNLVPATGGVYDTYILGRGSIAVDMVEDDQYGVEYERIPSSGDGGGATVVYSRVSAVIHPVGHRFSGQMVDGTPTQESLVAADSWSRSVNQRDVIAIARLRTREI